MRNFTLRKGFLGSKCGTRSSFKGFIMLVVLMLMMASSAMAQEAKFEVIGGLRYLLDTGAKTATLMPKTDSKYSGDIVVPEKVNSSDGMEYVVTGKQVKVLVLCNPDAETAAKAAGADYVGLDEYIDKIKGGWTDVDVIITQPAIMGKIGALGRVLGPRGLMPN